MTGDNSTDIGRRRSRGAEATSRKDTLERLKAIRQGGIRSASGGGYDIRLQKPIFDTVDDDEYDALVSRRREEARGFVVEDGEGGDLGYLDEGEEEDWSKPSGPESTDESDDGGRFSGRLKKKKKGKEQMQQPQVKKVNPALKAAATITGEGRLSSMFTSSSFKKVKETDKAQYEGILDEVIAQVTPDESDRKKHTRRKQPGTVPVTISRNKKLVSVTSSMEMKESEPTPLIYEDDCVFMENELMKEEDMKESEVTPSHNVESMEVPGSDSVIEDENKIRKAEVKTELGVKEVFTLNATIDMKEKDSALSATAGWKEAMGKGGTENGALLGPSCEGKTEFDLDADGSLRFYILDAYEEAFGASMGTIYLFGKVKMGDTYKSCCVVVKNIQRCVYAIPNDSIFPSHELIMLEQEVKDSQLSPESFRGKLHEMASKLKNEIAQELLQLNVSNFSMAPVKRNYAFERPDVPTGEQYVMKINYPFKDRPLPEDLKGESFCALLGSHTSALEHFILKRKIMGPSWLKIFNFSTCSPSVGVSWCKFEVTVESPKDITVLVSEEKMVHPPAVVTAINLKTIVNDKQNISEIVSASVLCFHNAKIEVPMPAPERKRSGILSHFTVVRNPEGTSYPIGWKKEVADRNSKNGCIALSIENSERALLNRLFLELNKLDSDVLVGHNISGFDLDVLLQRAQACKVQSSMWSKIGRLKRSFMPKLKGNTNFGSGATPGLMSCIAGRLLCDIDLCSRELLKQVSYSLTDLSKTQLNRDRKEIAPNDIPKMFQSSKTLVELIECGETDAWLSMELMFHLSVLPLTLQLTNISGNLWGKTLQGARSQRIEYYLLHTFHSKKYILPDKISQRMKEIKSSKRRMNYGPEDRNVEELDADLALENDPSKGSKTKKGPAYAGGLVLEPKRGLYDKYVLLLDFNSLYPSIIQEYNICFTTMPRSEDGVPRLPSSQTPGVLPKLMEHLVSIRKSVKLKMKKETGLKYWELDIRQHALKLTANSMYGCLGFPNSRFYAKPLAELITLQGREILQRTVDLVQNHLNLEVIYGDTDSIMIHSGLDDIEEVNAIKSKVIQEVNKKYRCLKIDCDGIYKRMLLLRKKKYAAVKLEFKDGKPCEDIERKGVDMVRRDWSLLSKEIGDLCLSKILYGGSCEDVVEAVHNELMKIKEEMRNGQVALEKYVITKTLTKPPAAYPDSKSQPHVQVALRMRQRGYKEGFNAKDTVPYIICYEQGNASSASSAGIAERARHPDEVKSDGSRWLVDIDYYLAQQIHPVVSRLCAEIQGTSPERLAECLGLDPSKYRSKSNDAASSDPSTSLLFAASDEERYKSCEPLALTCPSCSTAFNCPSITSSVCASINKRPATPETEESDSTFWLKLHCPKCQQEDSTGRISPAMIANQVKRQVDGFVSMYYKGIMVCDDESCKHTTRSPNFRLLGERERGTVCPNYPNCNGTLLRKYTEADLYKQLSYFCHILDTQHSLEKMDVGMKIQVEKAMTKIRPAVESAAAITRSNRDRCAYGWLQLTDIAI
ncbi:DNA polymerase alpha catalytic subunit [Arabidopsis lyrata subsp. lyrata]|uniref:DNA polymerase alpha catalytic subunit n=1 Tax=Arabidopsis lyrata subsp. lyrata TaxID=81972 RepID=UPI000A29D715|nr:DNA polymerase alpha catalytic subunit [Arabidopsis lyrata subsp. lyrata]XP_020880941.1 DNA polymerase alpha catalytic subunit [Arabidopsis lyrata subsp. lyrata]XP_020880947.1 DNA polymerase alpha catalytic subunit [Arabidopsis lyrata subsp. lyrata]|eukprot:XP_020880937.1 DNA polymerase alpha catalytic subunit [Arabidopsis lyrata subsp. lyrata]